MPFISNGIYGTSNDNTDGLFDSFSKLNVEYSDVDLTFFNNVLVEYSDIMNYASNRYSGYNPFFVKNDVLYCAGWFGPKGNKTDRKLRWHKYDLKKHTYSEQIIDGTDVGSSTENDKYMIVPVRRISGLKFYCIVVNADESSGNTYYCGTLCIIDYETNTYTEINPQSYVRGKAGLAYVGKSGYMYLRDVDNNNFYIDTNTENPTKTYIYGTGVAEPIFARLGDNGSDEIISIGLSDKSSSSVTYLCTSVNRPLEYGYIIEPSPKISTSSTDKLGTDYYHFHDCFGSYPVELNYKNIHCVWISGKYGRSVQLIVTGNTDLANKIQPFRLVGEIGYDEYVTDDGEVRQYVVRWNSIDQTGVDHSARPPFIPDLDKHVMYGIPAVSYTTTKKYAIMMRVSSNFLDELDAKGGEVW